MATVEVKLVKTVNLQLNEEEIRTLLMLCINTAGNPDMSRRKHADAIRIAWCNVGFKPDYDYPYVTGRLEFKDEFKA